MLKVKKILDIIISEFVTILLLLSLFLIFIKYKGYMINRQLKMLTNDIKELKLAETELNIQLSYLSSTNRLLHLMNKSSKHNLYKKADNKTILKTVK